MAEEKTYAFRMLNESKLGSLMDPYDIVIKTEKELTQDDKDMMLMRVLDAYNDLTVALQKEFLLKIVKV